LFPLLDDTSAAEKVKLLQSEFPVEFMKPEDLLISLLNRDYNQINPFTRVSAIHALDKIEGFHPGKDIVAQMFNPDPLMREESSSLVFRTDRELYNHVVKRLPADYRRGIDEFLKTVGSDIELGVYRKFRYLRQNELFNNFKNQQLLYIARKFELFYFDLNATLSLNKRLNFEQILLVVEGILQYRNGDETSVFKAGELTELKQGTGSEDKKFSIHEGTVLIIMLLDKSALQELVFDDENSYFPVAELLYPVDQVLNNMLTDLNG